ncbi:MAG: HAD-IG family 5'-nucleotidase [Deltaproteobacteria bacterium]|nr:HAD-IG family 5'-nucleotidase [Deltaproteobacteria bacterium]
MTNHEESDRPVPGRRVFCNRTLNLRAIRAVGFDMDYTLVHYRTEAWEERAYEHARQRLLALGWPLADAVFDPELATLGLVFDTESGNLVKADRFGYVKRAMHGTRMLSFEEQRQVYAGVLVDLAEPRFRLMSTLFALSEACLYAQTVDLFDARRLPGIMGYGGLYDKVRRSLDAVHAEGELKAEIIAAPATFVEADPALALTLKDLRAAGKKVLLITNSDWAYTQAMMGLVFGAAPDASRGWRTLFDMVIVSARKPEFFSQPNPLFEVVSPEGLLRPAAGGLAAGGVYWGGDAATVEKHLGLSGAEILYVGDHIFSDVHVSKSLLRWRTALVVREIEDEVAALAAFQGEQRALDGLMHDKEAIERRYTRLRLELLRREGGYDGVSEASAAALKEELQALRAELSEMDDKIAPLARRASELANPRWGLLMRAGNDKSLLARQIERYADIYTSRVSNLGACTPFAYLRAPRGSLPHDMDADRGSVEAATGE